MLSRLEHDEEWRTTWFGEYPKTPALVRPDPAFRGAASSTLDPTFALPVWLGQFGRIEPHNPQPVRLEGEDLPTRHARQRQATLSVSRRHGVLVELEWIQRHAENYL